MQFLIAVICPLSTFQSKRGHLCVYREALSPSPCPSSLSPNQIPLSSSLIPQETHLAVPGYTPLSCIPPLPNSAIPLSISTKMDNPPASKASHSPPHAPIPPPLCRDPS